MNLIRFRILGIFVISISIFTAADPAQGIYGGTPAAGNPIVVGLLSDRFGTSAGCSGALVAPQIVMTAAHCLTLPPQSLWIPEPGSDLRDTSTRRIQADRYFIPSDFSASRFPYQNDFGIVVLKSSFPNITTLEIATLDEIKKWMNEEREVVHVGYGCTELVDSPPCKLTSPLPNRLVTNLSRQIPVQFNTLIPGTFSATKISVEKTICGGDSGSPLVAEMSGKFIYVGAQSSSNGAGCTKTCNIVCVATQGLPSANVLLVEEAKKYASLAGPSPTPSSSPEVKVMQTPIPTPTNGQTISNNVKKVSITCVKGKLTKKVTAVNPKCPSGFKKK